MAAFKVNIADAEGLRLDVILAMIGRRCLEWS